jgi:hypothetical protein
MTEIDKDNKPVGDFLIGKESNYKQECPMNFHIACGRTQKVARREANTFNKWLKTCNLPNLPQIEFLDVSFYEKNSFCILAEKILNSKKFGFTKWNDNKGGIHNKQQESYQTQSPTPQADYS